MNIHDISEARAKEKVQDISRKNLSKAISIYWQMMKILKKIGNSINALKDS